MMASTASPIDSTQWVPAERLGQFAVDAALRPWLIGQGLLSERMRAACGARFQLRLSLQSTALLTPEQKVALPAADTAGLLREVELCCAGAVWVFVQTVVPDRTLCEHPWLAELGESSLSETLAELSNVERSPYEYAWLRGDDELVLRAAAGQPRTLEGLWARRARFRLSGAPLLVQELFLPATGRT